MNSILSRLPKPRIRTLPALIVAFGIMGAIFRLLITVIGLDGKGLMVPWHFTWICLWLVSIAAAAVAILGVLSLRGPANYRAAFPRSIFAAAGCVLAALSALGALASHLRADHLTPNAVAVVMVWVQAGLFVLAAAAFVLVGLCRLIGKKPTFLFHVVICVYFALRMLDLYRTWSFNPQIHEYLFQLFACIALTGMAYQLAAFDVGKGCHRKIWAFGLAAVYLCCVCATEGLFFVTGGLWAFTSLTKLRRPRQPRPEEAEIPAAE